MAKNTAANITDGDGVTPPVASGIENDVGASVDIAGIPVAKLPGNSGGSDTGSAVNTGGAKRGRKPGSTAAKLNAKREKATPTSIKGVEKILFSLHGMVAAATNIEELAIDDQEAALLSEAMMDVASFYNTVVDPKLVAWMGLIGVCGKIYAPRVMAYKMRLSIEKNASTE